MASTRDTCRLRRSIKTEEGRGHRHTTATPFSKADPPLSYSIEHSSQCFVLDESRYVSSDTQRKHLIKRPTVAVP
ncbi:hypothetical protein FSHL1_002906 [Fusarium sambucinum]